MAIHMLPVAIGLGGAALLAFLVFGHSGVKVPVVPTTPPTPGKTPSQLGTEDGCARGAADAKAGKSAAQAAADLAVGGKDNAALVAASVASGDSGSYLAAYALAHADCYTKTPKPITKVMPVAYKVGAGETPASIASKFGVSVDYLLSGLNGYGHGENGTKDNAPYPYGGDLHAFVSTFAGMGSGAFPPKGTTFAPTFQAGHKATANLRPIFRSSATGAGGQRYWWFPIGANPGAVPMPYSPNNAGFGLIYSDGGLKLVGPWYAGMPLNVPGKPGDTSATEGDVATSGVVVGAMNRAVRAMTGRTLVGARLPPRAVRANPINRWRLDPVAAVFQCMNGRWHNDAEDAYNAYKCAGGMRTNVRDVARDVSAQYTRIIGSIPSSFPVVTAVPAAPGTPVPAIIDYTRNRIAFCMAAVQIVQREGTGIVFTAGVARRPTSHPLGWPAPPT